MTYEHEADDEFPLYVLVDDALEKQRGMPGGIPIINRIRLRADLA